MEKDFQSLFFNYYDRAINEGITTFFQLGIDKDDFIRLCSQENFTLPKEEVIRLSHLMKVTEKERAEWLETLEE